MKVEISLVPFKHKNFPQLIELLESNKYPNIENIQMKTLPKVGYIAYMGGHPIACGFLRRVEGGFAQIDTLTSNAHFGSQIRHEGIKKVVDALILEAKSLKLSGILALTADQGILDRAKALGFHDIFQSVIGLKLT